MPIEWTEELAIGIARLDAQHRELYRAVASLHGAMRQGRLEEVPATLEFLGAYVIEHFGTEEEEMAAAGYPRLADHRAIHRAFIAEYVACRARFEAEGVSASLVVELSHWLAAWLTDHVRGVDGQMGRYLRAHRAAAAPPAGAGRDRPC